MSSHFRWISLVSLVLHIFVISVIPPVFVWTFRVEKRGKTVEIPAKPSIKLTQIMPNGFTHIMEQTPLNTAGLPGLLFSCKGTFIDAHIWILLKELRHYDLPIITF